MSFDKLSNSKFVCVLSAVQTSFTGSWIEGGNKILKGKTVWSYIRFNYCEPQNLEAEPPTSQTSENSILNSVSPSPELKEIKSQLSQLATSVHNHQKLFDSEKYHQEFPPKLPLLTSEKRYNVVVYGIDEAPSQTSRSTRQKHDLFKLLEVITSIDSSLTLDSIKNYHRLGKFKQDSPRPHPLLVKFLRAFEALVVLFGKSSLSSPHTLIITILIKITTY